MRHQWASVHELAQIAVLSGLPGEALGKLADRMERRSLAPGEALELPDSFTVIIAGLVTLTRAGEPARRLAPGDSIVAKPATLTALTPATVASCKHSTYSELTQA